MDMLYQQYILHRFFLLRINSFEFVFKSLKSSLRKASFFLPIETYSPEDDRRSRRVDGQVGWGGGGGRLQNTPTASLQRGKTSPRCVLGMTLKQSDGEVPVNLKLWGMQSTPLLPSLPGTHWPGVVTPDRVLSMGQIELNCVLMLNWIAWNRTRTSRLELQNTSTASLQRGKTSPTCVLGMTLKRSDGEVPVNLKLWGMQSTPLLPSLPGTHWPGVVTPDRVLSMGQIELNCVLMLNWIAWNRTWTSRLGQQNTSTASLQRGKTSPTCVLDI